MIFFKKKKFIHLFDQFYLFFFFFNLKKKKINKIISINKNENCNKTFLFFRNSLAFKQLSINLINTNYITALSFFSKKSFNKKIYSFFFKKIYNNIQILFNIINDSFDKGGTHILINNSLGGDYLSIYHSLLLSRSVNNNFKWFFSLNFNSFNSKNKVLYFNLLCLKFKINFIVFLDSALFKQNKQFFQHKNIPLVGFLTTFERNNYYDFFIKIPNSLFTHFYLYNLFFLNLILMLNLKLKKKINFFISHFKLNFV